MLYEVPTNLLAKTTTLYILNESGITELYDSGRLTSIQYKSIRINMIDRLGGLIDCYENNGKKINEILGACYEFVLGWEDCKFDPQPASTRSRAICDMWAKIITLYLCALSQLEALIIREESITKDVPSIDIPVYFQYNDTEQECISEEEYCTISIRMVNCIGNFLYRYENQNDDIHAFILQYEEGTQAWDDINFDTFDSVDNMVEMFRNVYAFMHKKN